MFNKNKELNIDKKLKRTFRDRKKTNEKKVSQMIQDFSAYYKNKLTRDVQMCTYEFYYEKFMIDDKHRHDLIYNKYYEFEYENFLYLYAVTLNNYFVKLNDNIDLSKLTDAERGIFTHVLNMTKECNFTKEFNYSSFYTNNGIRELICKNLKIFDNDFKNISNKNGSLFEY